MLYAASEGNKRSRLTAEELVLGKILHRYDSIQSPHSNSTHQIVASSSRPATRSVGAMSPRTRAHSRLCNLDVAQEIIAGVCDPQAAKKRDIVLIGGALVCRVGKGLDAG